MALQASDGHAPLCPPYMYSFTNMGNHICWRRFTWGYDSRRRNPAEVSFLCGEDAEFPKGGSLPDQVFAPFSRHQGYQDAAQKEFVPCRPWFNENRYGFDLFGMLKASTRREPSVSIFCVIRALRYATTSAAPMP